VSVSGAELAIRSHPHFAQWSQLRGLVTDGAIFTKAKIDEKRGTGGGALSEPLAADNDGGDAGAKIETEEEGGGGDGDDDELVE
jgi:hypothetical protein